MTMDRRIEITSPSCGNCRHFVHRRGVPDRGECRRRAPHTSATVPGRAIWPLVPADALCGEHSLGDVFIKGGSAA